MAAWMGAEKLLHTFEYLASKDALSFYQSSLSGSVSEKVADIRNVLLEKVGEGNFGIAGKDVFDATMSGRVFRKEAWEGLCVSRTNSFNVNDEVQDF